MRTLENWLGADQFGAAWRAYFQRWKFHHPRINDFTAAFDAAAGQDLTWFWSEVLRGTSVLDYEVLSIDNYEKKPYAGLFEADGGVREIEPDDHGKHDWHSEVVVHRRGDFVFPVTLKVVFEKGAEKFEVWDGGRTGPPWKRFEYDGPEPVEWATVDPHDQVPLDVNRWNNGLRDEPDARPRRRVVAGFGSIVSMVLAWVGF
jgi:hypothetical protein